MQPYQDKLIISDSGRIDEIADYWIALTEAAISDPEARSFLNLFGPWVAARIAQVSRS